jgi:hypothetical protein
MDRTCKFLCLALALAKPALAATPAAADPAAAVPPVRYESAFAGYRPYREQPLADWRGVNEEVVAAGGHIGIFGGASGHARHGAGQTPSPTPAAGTSADSQPPVRGAPKAAPAGAHQH